MNKELDQILNDSPFVRFMMEAMEKAGCRVDHSFIKMEHCSGEIEGGYRPPNGVVVCRNHIHSKAQMNNVLTHELIHAYDHCRARNIDWTNCEHHACSEIRAANVSGDCSWWQEMVRGNVFGFAAKHQACVKRRAMLSLEMNPYCKGKSKEAVDAVYETCFKDTAPFDTIP